MRKAARRSSVRLPGLTGRKVATVTAGWEANSTLMCSFLGGSGPTASCAVERRAGQRSTGEVKRLAINRTNCPCPSFLDLDGVLYLFSHWECPDATMICPRRSRDRSNAI